MDSASDNRDLTLGIEYSFRTGIRMRGKPAAWQALDKNSSRVCRCLFECDESSSSIPALYSALCRTLCVLGDLAVQTCHRCPVGDRSGPLTSSGGTSSLDMMLQLISVQHGYSLAVVKVSEQFIHERIRQPQDDQRMPINLRMKVHHPEVVQVETGVVEEGCFFLSKGFPLDCPASMTAVYLEHPGRAMTEGLGVGLMLVSRLTPRPQNRISSDGVRSGP